MDVIRSPFSLSLWVSRNKSVLALQGALFLFFLIFLSLRVDISAFFTFNLGRAHMFFLCNGIVAILVKGSVLGDPHEEGEAEKKKAKSVEGTLTHKTDEVSEEKSVDEEEGEKDQETTSGCVLVVETVEIDQQLVDQEEQAKMQGDEGGFEELSVEELNKKCDEFIKRMRGVISNGNGL